MEFETYTFRQFMQLAFSEAGVPSSKRVVGATMVFGVIIAAIIIAWNGGVSFLDRLLETMLITGASLLGLSSITSIWKNNDGSTSQFLVEGKKKAKEKEKKEE